MLRDADARAINIGTTNEPPAPTKMQILRRRARCCLKVAPWVSAVSNIMVAVGLAVWYIYTKRALGLTQGLVQDLWRDPLYLTQQLGNALDWTTLIMVIVVSCLLGTTMMVSMLRAYQYSARLPETSCGSPGKVSYGSYAGLIALLNFGWWLLTIVVVLLLAGSLVWLTVAFLFESALTMGVTYAPGQNLSSAELYVAARKAVDSLGTYATMVQPRVPSAVSIQPDVQSMNSNIQQFLAAAQGVPVTVCPVNCLNMGSFYDTLKLTSSCVCSDASIPGLRTSSTNLWKTLVHVLAALALMGLGCLWQLMNMSANFAHARRDFSDVPSHKYEQFISGDAIAAVHTAPYISPSKKSGTKSTPRDQDAGHETDVGFDNGFPATHASEPGADLTTATEHPSYHSGYEAYQDTLSSAIAAEPIAATSQRRASSPSPRNEGEQPSPSSGGRGATFNTTAQRYAAYRLRAAQAAAAKSSPSNEGGRRQWVR